MSEQIDAVYEHGAFRVVGDSDLTLTDGDRVKLIVESVQTSEASDVLKLAADVYAGLSSDEVTEIESIATDRSQFFSE